MGGMLINVGKTSPHKPNEIIRTTRLSLVYYMFTTCGGKKSLYLSVLFIRSNFFLSCDRQDHDAISETWKTRKRHWGSLPQFEGLWLQGRFGLFQITYRFFSGGSDVV